MKNLNLFIQKYNINIHELNGGDQNSLETTGILTTPKWLSKSAMVNDLSLRLTDDNYDDLIKRLNALYSIQGVFYRSALTSPIHH